MQWQPMPPTREQGRTLGSRIAPVYAANRGCASKVSIACKAFSFLDMRALIHQAWPKRASSHLCDFNLLTAHTSHSHGLSEQYECAILAQTRKS